MDMQGSTVYLIMIPTIPVGPGIYLEHEEPGDPPEIVNYMGIIVLFTNFIIH